MKEYKVNEIFYSVQGEGFHTGEPAVFVRFSGCNLSCPWCDTKGHENGTFYTADALEHEVLQCSGGDRLHVKVILTGGEPTLQLSEEEELFRGFYRCIETNGTRRPPSWIDWVTVSPKDGFLPAFTPDELKIIFEPGREAWYDRLSAFSCMKYLQPMEQNGRMNIQETVAYVLAHPVFRLSLQTHKLIGVR